MKIREIAEILNAKVLCGQKNTEEEIKTGCGSDLMSDVLAYVKDQGVLLTGLVSPQVVRTASMMDIRCIVLVRGKQPDESLLLLAEKMDITLLCTTKTMFLSCGLLYQNGLKEGEQAHGRSNDTAAL